ncbi:MAG: glycosyltransferase family 2 protein [Candidatus Omnitrophota bacterium]
MKISVLIPVYNERQTIEEVLKHVKATPFNKEIIVVDDGSADSTGEFLRTLDDPEVKVFYHQRNYGKGAALKTAIKEAQGDIVIFQDADLEYDPQEYTTLIDPIIKGMADVVYGSRMSGGRPQRVYMFWHKVGNIFLSFLTNLLYNTTLTDMETGYKVFKSEIIKNLKLKSNGFCIEPEITAKIFKRKLRVYEIPISYYGRNYSEGKKISWRQGFSAIVALLFFRFFE